MILFQLLTGELPFRGNARMLHAAGHPRRAAQPAQAQQQRTQRPGNDHAQVPGEGASRRYQTARELSDEFRRFLIGEPIHARPISRAARTWRWAKRRPAAATVLGLLVVVAFGSAAAFIRERELRHQVVAQQNETERRRIEAEERKAEADSERASADAVVDFLLQDILAKASPEEQQDKAVRDMLVKTLIEPAAATVGQRFKDKPLIEAVVRSQLATILLTLGRSDLAQEHAERALALRREVLGEDHPQTIKSLNNYAHVLFMLGQSQQAEPLFKQALEQKRKVSGEDDPETIASLNNYAAVLESLGRGSVRRSR